ncbi:gliding motility-associated C-terminal domain-containing protein [Hymenobacter sp. BT186]|uniref:Gliding motility-associated C-terminal domain-containing protein n=1 Tax=Hymenobacter telluris TaxID=2816474 RepID=A0A939ET78_9BACT|nr:gliding motility-associated C-terminal domain-containing protein [Hymenobacter telluris]MBO0357018.1 gliding motility-associated C-terminal domain-containing protein [Hymenobacter telluris]MBW3373045.1 gliding motility-associated C-terminal domain-containing protein [Hymenobacter norwichensis]
MRHLLLLLVTNYLLLFSALAAESTPAPKHLEFVANQGQWAPQVRFAGALAAGQLFAEPTGFTYALYNPHTLPTDSGGQHTSRPGRLRCHAYSVTFAGGQPVSPEGLEPTTEVRNYFLGQNTTQWANNVRSFRRLHYPNIYPGTDAYVYENSGGQLEYDFVLAPGAQPTAIQLRYTGPYQLALSAEGNLLVRTSVGTVTEQAPKAWQDINGQRVAVPCAFELRGNTVRFRLGAFDTTRPLTIDPTVVFATFTGSTADNWGFTATHDAQGNLYSAGVVFGAGYPASPGAYDRSYAEAADIAIIKYNTQVQGAGARLYATYLGGSGTEAPHRLTVSASGDLVILGTTSSSNFPVSAQAYSRSFAGGPSISPDEVHYSRGADLFVARLSATGGALQATFLGSNATDGFVVASTLAGSPPVTNGPFRFLGDVALAADGGIVLASVTGPGNFPAVAGYSTTFRGGASDAVVCKLSADLRQLVWSTYLGGSGSDAAYALQFDAAGRIYVVGSTFSSDFPVTAGAYRPLATGFNDGFVVRLSADGRSLERACVLGTATYDNASLLQLDATGQVYVLGNTAGRMPLSPGHFTEGGNVYLQKLDPDLSRSLFITQFGDASGIATSYLQPTAFGLDACGRLRIAGIGSRSVCTFQLSADAVALEARGTFGGDHVHGQSRFDSEGTLYQAVCGNCEVRTGLQFQVPPGANYYSLTNNAVRNCNDASLKIRFPALVDGALPPAILCQNAVPLLLGGTPAGGTWSGTSVALGPDGQYYFTPTPALLGTYTLRYTLPAGAVACSSPTQTLAVTVRTPSTVTFTTLPATPVCVNNEFAVSLVGTPAGGIFSGPGVEGGVFRPTLAGPGTHTLTYTLNTSTQCGSATRAVTVLPIPTVAAGPDTVLCGMPAAPFRLAGASPAGGTWSGRGVSADGVFDAAAVLRLVAGPSNNYLTYTVRNSLGCTATARRTVTLVPDVTATATELGAPACTFRPDWAGLAPFRVEFPQTANGVGIYTWSFGDGTTEVLTQFQTGITHTYSQPGTYAPVLSVRYGPACTTQLSFRPFTVGEAQDLPNIITPNGDSKNDTFVQRWSCEPPALRIFSRWGSLLYSTAAYHNDWNAAGLADGVYYYELRGADNRRAKGWLEVKR